MMLALAAYIFAALFLLTNLYAPSAMAEKIGFFAAALGVWRNLWEDSADLAGHARSFIADQLTAARRLAIS